MRSKEFIIEQQIDEINIKQALGTAALATGLGFGGLAYKYGTEQEPNTQRQSSGQVTQAATQATAKKAKPAAPQIKQVDMSTISKSDLAALLKDYSVAKNIQWQPNEFNQFLAQIFHETSNLDKMSENLYYTTPRVVYKTFTSSFRKNPKSIKNYLKNPQALANLVYANRMGNGDEQSGDGWKYRGRGLLHITGKENYAKVGRGIGVDLLSNPDLLTTNSDASIKAAIWYWKNVTGAKLAKQDKNFSDTRAVTKTINPASAGIKSRLAQFSKLQKQDAVKARKS